MLYKDFINKFPPSNTGEFTERMGDNLKVTWKMINEEQAQITPVNAELKINFSSLELDFSLLLPKGKMTGSAFVEEENIKFRNKESEEFFSCFIEKVQHWFKSSDKITIH